MEKDIKNNALEYQGDALVEFEVDDKINENDVIEDLRNVDERIWQNNEEYSVEEDQKLLQTIHEELSANYENKDIDEDYFADKDSQEPISGVIFETNQNDSFENKNKGNDTSHFDITNQDKEHLVMAKNDMFNETVSQLQINDEYKVNNEKEKYFDNVSYDQGRNDWNAVGTCGPTSVANSLNRITESSKYTENDMLHVAINENLCNKTPEHLGATSTNQVVSIIEKVDKNNEFNVEVHEYSNVLNLQELAEKVDDPSTVAIVGVDSMTLWSSDDVSSSGLFYNDVRPSDHWITVDSTVKDHNGDLIGFNIIDSGGGVDFVTKEKMEDIYLGNEEMIVSDPTIIVVEKKDDSQYVNYENKYIVNFDEAIDKEFNRPEDAEKIEGLEIFNDNAITHIFKGDIENHNGFHFLGYEDANARTIGTMDISDNGVLRSAVIFDDGVPKLNGGGQSTFFPYEYSKQDVVNSIIDVSENEDNFVSYDAKRDVEIYQGRDKNGIGVRVVKQNGKIHTAFPIYE